MGGFLATLASDASSIANKLLHLIQVLLSVAEAEEEENVRNTQEERRKHY